MSYNFSSSFESKIKEYLVLQAKVHLLTYILSAFDVDLCNTTLGGIYSTDSNHKIFSVMRSVCKFTEHNTFVRTFEAVKPTLCLVSQLPDQLNLITSR